MIDRNDPRLTAYALGEMNDKDRVEFEKALETDPAAKGEVEAIRALGKRLQEELEHGAAPALTEAQRSSVARAARRRVPLAILLMPVAAILLVAVTFLVARGPKAAAPDPRAIAKEETLRVGRQAEVQAAPQPGFQGPNGTVAPGARQPAEPARELESIEAYLESMPASEPQGGNVTVISSGQGAAAIPPPSDPGASILLAAPTSPQGPPARSLGLSDSRAVVEFEARRGRRENGAEPLDREGYDRIRDNPFIRVSEEDVSTFSIDVDTASYANVRRFLTQNQLPPADAVRIEEMVNYFSYAYEPPAMGSPDPFRIHVEVAQCPWDATHRLARVAIKGKVIDSRERPASNLVFLVDVSGSMNEPMKLPLVQASLRLLAQNLGEKDRVAIVVYAGAAGLVLPSTGDKQQVIDAIDRLRAGGSTAGAAGIELAYKVAAENLLKEGTNRVILCTDGDFNVGISDDGSLTRFIEEKAKSGVFLSVLGFGTGNYQDGKMQQLADRGNGNHAYIDSILEARKVLGEEMSGTLVTIAKDVKIQIFFNPRKVAGFRLIGYENRLLNKQDFNDDTKDAGEIGAGHSVTALYELIPAGSEVPAAPPVDENPFLAKAQAPVDSDALFQLRLRYKEPDGDTSKLLEEMVKDGGGSYDAATADFRFASAVAAFGMSLRGTTTMGLDAVMEIAKGAIGDDKYRQEFLKLVETAKLLRR